MSFASRLVELNLFDAWDSSSSCQIPATFANNQSCQIGAHGELIEMDRMRVVVHFQLVRFVLALKQGHLAARILDKEVLQDLDASDCLIEIALENSNTT